MPFRHAINLLEAYCNIALYAPLRFINMGVTNFDSTYIVHHTKISANVVSAVFVCIA